jgi:Leucine-rich repeat (LRR) protein
MKIVIFKTQFMKSVLTILTAVLFSSLSIAQTTAIPDPYFEIQLIYLGLDTGNPDGSVPTANISNVTQLYLSGKDINDLTGIEGFTALTLLTCNSNNLTNLDLSQNTALTWLECQGNQITYLDLSQNTLLSWLTCYINQLTSLVLPQNSPLNYVNCTNNLLTSLDITQNTSLTSLDCYNNQITSLDVTQNIALEYLNCSYNQLSSLDVSQNINLLDLSCYNNQLSSLNVSQNNLLNILNCHHNQLTCLNVKNGNNVNITYFLARDNTNLTCIEVEDETWSTNNWTSIDPAASFSTSCSNPCIVGINEHNSSNLSVYPNPTTGNISIELKDIKNNFKLVLSNSLGQVLFSKNYDVTDNLELNINYPKGLYFLHLKPISAKQKTIKIIKN